MKRALVLLALGLSLGACRGYDENSRLSSQDGLVPPDVYARYGREQAQAVAIAREYGYAEPGRTPEGQIRAAEAAVKYGRTLPDVVAIGADSLGYRVTVEFRSGWRTMVNPIADGKRGAETPGLPAAR